MAKVLVIEDEAAIRGNVIDILSAEGFEVFEAENGVIGLEMARAILPDIILCDVMMPELDGHEVVKALRQDVATTAIPVVFLTARASKADFRQGMVLGANDYLTKPFTALELLEAIDSQLARQIAIEEKHQLELREIEERITRSLSYDPITALPNQFLLREQFQQLLEATSQSSQSIAVLYIHLSQFEHLEATLAPDLYQQLQQALAERLKKWGTEGCAITRLRENQFLLMVQYLSNQEEIETAVQELLAHLEQPFDVESQRTYLPLCIGVSLYPEHGTQIDSLVKNAELAAQSLSRQGMNAYQFYSENLSTRSLEVFLLTNELRVAWEESYFQVYYQPQVQTQTGKIVGSEALIRCLHPEKGLLPPARFIPLAEAIGLIVPIGEWVARTACEQTKQWQGQIIQPLRIAVNLSPRQFNQTDLEQVILRLLAETVLDPTCLELEITESCVMEDLPRTIQVLKSLKDRGIKIALDDFGTGYASLSHLKQIPVDSVKIDRLFISNIQEDQKDQEIVKNIIQIAHRLGLKTIAEGVETQAEWECLRQYECDELQGYLFSRPISALEFGTLLKRGGCF
ncbi:MAG: EAL domain-containing protein [Leptolyngbyaceae cyanobacterium bins.59]|nr:EAL domain-containing protein [Leptolyngbyaceae cyanobacterium bins.59]